MANLLNASEQGKRPQIAKLSEPHTSGSGSFTCEALAGWANECSFVAYEVDTEGNPINGSETDWIGAKNNRTLENLELTAGVDRDYPTDRTYIIATETAGGRNKLVQGLKKTLDDNGNLKPTIVSENNLSNNSVGTNNLKDNSITTEKLASKAVKSNNVDWATFDKIMISGYGESAQNTGVIWLDSVKVKVGDRLTEFSGGVKIGAGVTMVSVSALAFFVGKPGYSWAAIFKNDERIQDVIVNTNDVYNSGSLPNILMPVSENDIITLRTLENGNVLRRNQTYLTVEMIG